MNFRVFDWSYIAKGWRMLPFAVGLGVLPMADALADDAVDAEAEVAEVAEAAESTGVDAEGFASFEQRVSYAIGATMGGRMAQQFAELDFQLDAAAFGAGFGDSASAEAAPKLSEAQIQTTLMEFERTMQQRQFEKMSEQATANAAAGEAFLAENATKEGVQTTEAGVQFLIEELGEGTVPGPNDEVLVHYEGRLLDGTVFDSSFERGQPAPFPLDGVIAGFQDGLTQMPIGTKATLFIPGDMAYGMSPPPGSPIEPNSTLIFRVELLELLSREATPEP